MLRIRSDMPARMADKCHGGEGQFFMTQVLDKGDSDLGIKFMHDNILEPGTTFGEHGHQDEEIYFVLEGHGEMILDGERHPIGPGDVSLVKKGHSHGIVNSGDSKMRLIVVGFAHAGG